MNGQTEGTAVVRGTYPNYLLMVFKVGVVNFAGTIAVEHNIWDTAVLRSTAIAMEHNIWDTEAS